MEHSNIKKSIDEVIGTERWMTERLAHKMIQPKNQKRSSFISVPILSSILVAALLFFVIQLVQPTNKNAVPSEALLSQFEDKKLGLAFVNYLTALKDEDLQTIEALSIRPITPLTIQDIFPHYKDFPLQSLKVLKFSMEEKVPYTYGFIYYTYVNPDGVEILNGINAEMKEGEWYFNLIGEPEGIVYTPFTFPEKLAFQFEKVIEYLPEEFYHEKDMEQFYPSVKLGNGVSAHFYDDSESYINIALQFNDEIYNAGYFSKPTEPTDQPYYTVEVITSEAGVTYYVIQSPEIIHVKHYNADTKELSALPTMPAENVKIVDVDHDGVLDILINDTSPRLATVNNNIFVMTYVEYAILDSYFYEFLSYELFDTHFTVTYTDEFGEKSASYSWHSFGEGHLIQ